MDEADAERRDGRRRNYLYHKAWGDFEQTFIGDVWSPDAGIGPSYFPDARAFEEWTEDAIRCISKLCFRGIPPRPDYGKWTELVLLGLRIDVALRAVDQVRFRQHASSCGMTRH